MECLRLDLSLFLETVNYILITPSHLMRQTLVGRVKLAQK
jgi:hypothetical protein